MSSHCVQVDEVKVFSKFVRYGLCVWVVGWWWAAGVVVVVYGFSWVCFARSPNVFRAAIPLIMGPSVHHPRNVLNAILDME